MDSEELEKYEVLINEEKFTIDGIDYEYSQQDGDAAGRSDDGTMTRDVVGLANKVYCKFNDKSKWYGINLSKLLKLTEIKECDFNYFDAKAYERITRRMYLVADKCECTLIDGETYMKSDIEFRFIQMDLDNI